MSTYFTGDTHFGHTNIIRFCNRPFKNVDEMNEALIENWNAVVKPSDTIYHLGDFCFGNPHKYLPKLNGKIYFILGNHDKDLIKEYANIPFKRVVSINGQCIVLSHFAMRVWDKSHFNSWHLYGHSHNCLPSYGKSFDVGVDAWHYYPISFEQVKEHMSFQPDNANWVVNLPGYKKDEYKEECIEEGGEPIYRNYY